MKAESSAWLDKAEEDYSAADWLLKSEAPLTLATAFRIQQCEEKLLKTLLVEKGTGFEKRHDLPYLLERAAESSLQPYLVFLERLSPYAVEFCYPGDFVAPSEEEAQQLLSQLASLRTVIIGLLQNMS